MTPFDFTHEEKKEAHRKRDKNLGDALEILNFQW